MKSGVEGQYGMKLHFDRNRIIGLRSPMIYGHFLEHFHRQIYGGIFDPGNPLSDEDGFRMDVLDAMKDIHVPVIRYPGGCFVSSYHWKDGVGPERKPVFNKSWRVEEPNTFGTDEYIRLCRKIGCEPYICTNAGTGTTEEMSDWVEYCNLDHEGKYAGWRIANGHREPYHVRYWSIGNENYGSWEIGAKDRTEWGRLVAEACKMIRHVDPETELTAAALTDLDWNVSLLRNASQFLDWISLHEYWDPVHETNALADYETCMAYTNSCDHSVKEVRGLLTAMHLEHQIRIAFDEWNLRQWYHPGVMDAVQARTKEEYLLPRDKNDENSSYTMADAVFSACFLNAMNRNCDIVGMACFAPIVNTRGCIFTYAKGIVLRSTYYVFDLYVNYLGDIVLDSWTEENDRLPVRNPDGEKDTTDAVDIVATAFSSKDGYAIAAVNKDPSDLKTVCLDFPAGGNVSVHYICGNSTESYNDVNHTEVSVLHKNLGIFTRGMPVLLEPHSVSVIQIASSKVR